MESLFISLNMNFPLKKLLLLVSFFACMVKSDEGISPLMSELSESYLDALARRIINQLASMGSDIETTTPTLAPETTTVLETTSVPVTTTGPTIIPGKEGFVLVFNQLSASQNITVTLPCHKLFGKNYNKTVKNKYILDSCDKHEEDNSVEYVGYGPFKKIYSDCC